MFLMNSIDFMLMGFYVMWWFSSLTVLPLTKMLLLCATALDHNSGLVLYMPEFIFCFTQYYHNIAGPQEVEALLWARGEGGSSGFKG